MATRADLLHARPQSVLCKACLCHLTAAHHCLDHTALTPQPCCHRVPSSPPSTGMRQPPPHCAALCHPLLALAHNTVPWSLQGPSTLSSRTPALTAFLQRAPSATPLAGAPGRQLQSHPPPRLPSWCWPALAARRQHARAQQRGPPWRASSCRSSRSCCSSSSYP